MDEFVRRPRPSVLDEIKNNKPIRPTHHSFNEPSNIVSEPAKPQGDIKLLPKPRFNLPKFRKPRNKKEWIISALIALLLIGGIGFGTYWLFLRKDAPIAIQLPAEEPEPVPTTVASEITGLQVKPEINDRPVFAIQIENSMEARPQSGLIDADIVFEAIAEGGITRFNAIYHDSQPKNIGPIRSLRPYYIDWFWPFDASIVHAGGSGGALADVQSLNLMDIEHGVNADAFRRVTNRYAPHNLYSTSANLLKVIDRRNYQSDSIKSLLRKESSPAETPTASTINLNISSANFNVKFSYDKKNNRYMRTQGGAKHVDADSGKQLWANTVVVPVLSRRTHSNGIHTVYGTTGSGKVYVFQDGVVTIGTWKKSSRQAQWQFTDASGKEIALNPGKTWFTIIDSGSAATYSAPTKSSSN
ncbi:MAG: DUF3048 domain-containing protein [bacterium]|nr:DUF3048 domain-containing protein [bacterium]